MNDRDSARACGRGSGSPVRPEVDSAIERLIASMPLRRPGASLEVRMRTLFERTPQPAGWTRRLPLAAAAVVLLGVGFVAGAWLSTARLGRSASIMAGSSTVGAPATLRLVHQDSSLQPAALGESRILHLGDGSAVLAAPSIWIRTDRFLDPDRGVTIERSYPETWTLIDDPAAD